MTKNEIKNISLSLFTKYGYEGTALSEIAKRSRHTKTLNL